MRNEFQKPAILRRANQSVKTYIHVLTMVMSMVIVNDGLKQTQLSITNYQKN